MDLFKCLRLSNIITLMNMCIQTTLDGTLIMLKGMFFFFVSLLYNHVL